MKLAADASVIHIAKGKKVLTYDMKKDPPDKELLLKGMLGPSGTLRAPVIRKGKTLLVGFDESMYGNTL